MGRTTRRQRASSIQCYLPDAARVSANRSSRPRVPNPVEGGTLTHTQEPTRAGALIWISGPLVKARISGPLSVLEQVQVGEARLAGEVIGLNHDIATIQVYEETNGLRPGEPLCGTGAALSVMLGPGL